MKSMRARPVYVTPEIEPEFIAGLQRVPEGLAFRLFADTLYHDVASPVYRYRPLDRQGRLENALRNLYAASLVSRGVYYQKWGKTDVSGRFFREALGFNPDFREAQMWLQRVGGR